MESRSAGRPRQGSRGTLLILLFTCLLLAFSGRAQAAWSPSVTLTEGGTKYSFGQDVGPDDKGTVVWAQPHDGGYSVFARRFGAVTGLGGKVQVSDPDPDAVLSSAYAPAVRYAADGTATVVWMESSYGSDSCFNTEGGSGGEADPCVVDEYVWARQFSADGTPSVSHVLYHRHAVYPDEGSFGGSSPAYVTYGQPALAGGPGGTLTVVWSDGAFGSGCAAYGYSGSYADAECEAQATIRWIRLGADAVPQGSAQVAYADATSGYGSGQPLLNLRAGAASDGTATILFGARVSAAESSCWGGESKVSFLRIGAGGATGSATELDSGCGAVRPDLAVDPGGTAIAAWGWSGVYSADEALYSRIGPSGTADAPQALIDSTEGAHVSGLDIARGVAGSALAVWSEEGRIVSRRIPVAGSPGPITEVAAPAPERQFIAPRLAVGSDDSAMVVWEAGSGPYSGEYGLRAAQLAPDGTPGAPQTLMATNRWDHGVRVSAGSVGGFLASWRVSMPGRNRVQSAWFGSGQGAGNDDFAAATTLGAELPEFSAGSTTLAGKQLGEPDHAGESGGASVWFSWTPESGASVTLSTCADDGLDPVLAVYTGTAIGALQEVAFARGGAASRCTTGDAGVRFDAVAGTTYRIAVDGEDGSRGSFGLKLVARGDPPRNDDFDDAVELAGYLPRYVSDTTVDAAREPDEPEHGGDPGGASVWYSWTPETSGPIIVSVCGGGGQEALLGVYTGASLGSLVSVAEPDASPGCPSGMAVRFDAVAGTTYRLAVDGRGGGEGWFGMRVASPPPNDDFAAAQEVGLGGTTNGSTLAAGKEPGEPDHAGDPGGASVWYSWTPNASGIAFVSTCLYGGLSRGALLAVYTGEDLEHLTEVGAEAGGAAVGGSASGCNRRYSEVRVEYEAGTRYLIAVDGPGGTEAGFSLQLDSLPVNDDVGDASSIAAVPPQYVYGSNRHAGKEPGEPDHAGDPGGASVWYSWTPNASGTAFVSACLYANSSQSPLVGVYTGPDSSHLEAVSGQYQGGPATSCSTNTGSFRFDYQAGTRYLIAVDGRDGGQGFYSLALESLSANDEFGRAQPIPPDPPQFVNGSNRHAGKEPGEPGHAGDPGGASVWYSWTPNASGTAFVSACLYSGGARGALLGVYTGAAVGALTEVGSRVGGGTQDGCFSGAENVRLDFSAGVTYHFAVDGEGGEESAFALRLDQRPANDDFAAAQPLGSWSPQYVYGTNLLATRQAGEPEHGGDPGGASVWYSWTPQVDRPVSLAICSFNGFSPALAVYTGPDLEHLATVASATGGPSTPVCPSGETRLGFEAQAGVEYRIAVDSATASPFTLRLEEAPANDSFADPREVAVGQFTGGSTTLASKQLGEPDHAGDPGGASVWFSWTADRDGSVRVLTCHATFDVALAVYAGEELGLLEPVGGGTASGECAQKGDAGVTIDAVAGTTYRIAVDGVGGASGNFSLLLAAPDNDAFEAATPLAGSGLQVFGSNFIATKQLGEPGHAGDPGGASVWYSWTAPSSDRFRLSTCFASFSALLAVYTGDSLDQMTPVPTHDAGPCSSSPPAPGGGPPGDSNTGPRRLTFDAVAGTNYRIAVDGSAAAEGYFYLELGLPPDTEILDRPTSVTSLTEAFFSYGSDRLSEVDRFECSLDEEEFAPCPAVGVAYDGLEDGSHTFRVRSVDFEGSADATPASWSWRVDTVPPDTEIAAGRSGAVSSRVATFSYRGIPAEDAERFQCSLDGAAFGTCPDGSVSYAGLGEGEHTFRVRAVDAAGNADGSPAQRTWTVDTIPPQTAVDAGPSGAVASSAAGFEYSGSPSSDVDRFECRLDDGPYESCAAAGRDYADLPDGAHTFRVRAVDVAGNADPSPAERGWTIDTTPPSTGFVAFPAEHSPDPAPLFEFAAEEPADFECALDSAPLAPCASPLQLSGLADGQHTLRVRGTDAVGNVEVVGAIHTWTVDTVAPQTELTASPDSPTASASASFGFDADEPAHFECSLDGVSFASCASPRSFSGLADGEHSFAVRAIDAAGNVDATVASHDWRVDTTPPDTAIESGPSGTVTDDDVEFTYAGLPAEDAERFQCSLDGAGFAACSAEGRAYAALDDGPHDFRVRAIDAVDNVDASPAERLFEVESRPPKTTITAGPAGLVADSSPTFEFESSESGDFECSLDEGPFTTCESPFSPGPLADGSYRLAVRAVDRGGSVDPNPAVREFRVDTTAPDTVIEAGPAGTVTSSAAIFDYAGQPDADTARFECSLDGAPFVSCASSGASYNQLSEGSHSFRVRAIDAIANADPSPAERSWTIDFSSDHLPPQTAITAAPATVTGEAAAEFRFAADEPDSSFECALDDGPFEACASPRRYEGLTEGGHGFAVRATDPAGNTDPSPATRSWTIDLTAPETAITSGPGEGATIAGRRPLFTYTGMPPADLGGFECRLDSAPFASCPVGGKQFAPLPGGPHTFAVRAVDPYGNADATPATRGFVVPPNHAPEAELSLTVGSGFAPLAVGAAITASDPDGDPVSYKLSFGDGSAVHGGSTLPDQPVGHSFTHAGTFQVRLRVSDGDEAVVRTTTAVVALPEPPRAEAGDDRRAVSGEAVDFDGGGSRPPGLVESFHWEFGDGASAGGPAPSHAYSAPGTYTVTLTVANGEETESDTATVVVEPPSDRVLSVRVTGAGQPLAGATVLLVRPDGGRQSAGSDGAGIARLPVVPDGPTTVYVTAPGYRPAAVAAAVADGQGSAEVDLQPGEPGAATLESKRLTYEEILAAGIDVADPENSHVYEARIHLFFVPDEPVTPPHVARLLVADGGIWCYGCPGGGGGGGEGSPRRVDRGITVGGYTYLPEVIYVEGEPLIQWLVLPIRASWLKEFFDVKLIVQNLTGGLVFAPGVASLDLPEGLSLAPTAAPQSLRREVGAIPAGESATIDWVVRGDTEGEYDLAAEYSSSIDAIGQSVHLRARTREPLKVWGASALRTRILVDEKAVRWGPYAFDVEITNVSDVPVYNMQVEMLDREANRPEREALFFYAPFPPQVQGTAEIPPGETWTAHYVVFAGLGNQEITRMRVVLEQSFVERTGGDVDLKPELGLRDGTSLSVNAGPIRYHLDEGGPEDEAVLSWDPPKDPVVGYELWTRQALDRGKWEFLENVPAAGGGEVTTRISSSMRAVGRYYAVGSRRPGGGTDFVHQLGVGPARYVALGDSFSAGEGVPAFEPGTDTDITLESGPENACHRSERGSYSRRLVADPEVGGNILPADFAACSGAVARDLETPNPDNEGEPAQIDHLNEFTNLVTLTMGGNDIGFGDIAALCTMLDCSVLDGVGSVGHTRWANLVGDMWTEGSFLALRMWTIAGAVEACGNPADVPQKFMCLYKADKAMKAIGEIIDRDPDRVANILNLYNGRLQNRLVRGYRAIATAAPNARVLVQLYPPVTDGYAPDTLCHLYGSLPVSLSEGERAAIGTVVTDLNREIERSVANVNAQLRASGRPGQLVAVAARGFSGHGLCHNGNLNEQSYFNSVVIPGFTGPHSDAVTYSFHPNALGQQALADSLVGAIGDAVEANVVMVRPEQTTGAGSAFVPFGGRTLHASASWPGSTVKVSLVSPGGKAFDADTPGVLSGSTEISEWLEVPDPEAGSWQVRLYGEDVEVGGEPTQVIAYADNPTPSVPDVDLTATPVPGQTDTFDLVATGPPGEYSWTFSDGGGAEGASVRHAFAPGSRMSATVHVGADGGGGGWFPLELGAPAIDETPPLLIGVPGDLIREADSQQGVVVEYAPAAVDGVDGALPVTCSPPSGAVFPLGETEVVCAASDSSGNRAAAAFHVLVQDLEPPDTTPPNTAIATGPGPGATTGAAVSFTYSGTPGADVAGFECRLDEADFAACPIDGRAYGGLASGSHVFEARAFDSSENADPSPALRSFVVDADPPETTIDSGPSGSSEDVSPVFGFSSEAGAVFECRLDEGGFSSCASPKSYASLAVGAHFFEVRAVDAVGNRDASPSRRGFSVVAPPESPSTPSPPAGPPSGPVATPPPTGGKPATQKPKCKRGYVKKNVRGTVRCVKKKKKKKQGR